MNFTTTIDSVLKKKFLKPKHNYETKRKYQNGTFLVSKNMRTLIREKVSLSKGYFCRPQAHLFFKSSFRHTKLACSAMVRTIN